MATVRFFYIFVCLLLVSTGHLAEPSDASNLNELAWKFEYDENGRLSGTIDPAGLETRFKYMFGDDDRLSKIIHTYADGSSVDYEFDAAGRLTAMNDGAGTVSYGYDKSRRLNSVARQDAHKIVYTHDSLDRVTSMQVGDIYRIDYTYDFLGRLSSMNTPAGKITYEYQAGSGQVIRSLPNGVKTFWTRKPNGELDEITHGLFKKPKDRQYQLLAQYIYQHGPDGRINAIRERSPEGDFIKRYTYDNMGRLVRAEGPEGKVYTYAYDQVGNRIAATTTGKPDQAIHSDWAGRLTRVNDAPCAYDAGGNLAELTIDGVARRYRYHPDGRLAKVRTAADTAQYRYDGFGRLIARETNAHKTRFVNNHFSSYWQPLIIETEGEDPILVIWDGAAPLALVRAGKVEWQLHDHLSSVRVVTDAAGYVVRYLEHDPFGEGGRKSTEKTLSFGFAGLVLDSVADLYLTLDRGYLPQLGSFLQPDPLKSVPVTPQTNASLYQYCDGDPISYVDARGQARQRYDTTSPNFFSMYQADVSRSVADQLDDDRFRERARQAEDALSDAKQKRALDVEGFQEYSTDNMTLFVRKFNPLFLRETLVPHTGVHFGRELNVSGLRFDGVELQNTRISGQEGMTVILPMRLQEQEPYGTIRLQPLESKDVKVVYEGRPIPVADLPYAKKAEIQTKWMRITIDELGKTWGRYEIFGQGYSNNCADFTLSTLDRAIKDSGLEFETLDRGGLPLGRGFRETYSGLHAWMQAPVLRKFTGRTVANPSSFFGYSAFLPRSTGASPPISSNELMGHTRSRVMQNRAQQLVSFGGVVLPSAPSWSESLGSHSGTFSGKGAGYSFSGGWSLHHNREGFAGMVGRSDFWSASVIDNLLTMDGARISGEFRQSATRIEGGGHLGNLFGPTSITTKRHRIERYRISTGGGMIMAAEPRRTDQHDRKINRVFPPPQRPEDAYEDTMKHDWRAGAGGGPPPPGGGGGASLSPSPVGGVYLSGAGGAVDGLDVLKGIRLDANGNLVLIGEDSGDIGLPPLRIDDVVTVFRSVYLHGEGPNVSIDPKSEDSDKFARAVYLHLNNKNHQVTIDPHADRSVTSPKPDDADLSIKHGIATKGTYVGWLLYQADRLMKGYGQGVDNQTLKPVMSSVPGYSDVLKIKYSGWDEKQNSDKDEIWERYWIVPAEVSRFEGPRRELTVFDVPLKVKTQKMKWVNGQLDDDPDGKSSPGATAFTSWFTANYDGIAAEQYLIPPKGSGLNKPVPVFMELRRIALMTAIAEKLRDQKVPMPFWMRDYDVSVVPFELETPSLRVTLMVDGGNSARTMSITGGVGLSADNTDIKTYATLADVKTASTGEDINAKDVEAKVQAVKLADRLEMAVAEQGPPAVDTPLSVHRVVEGNRSFQAVSIPGADTLALSPCRLDEVDLAVPFSGGRDIRLVRRFNSFFNPRGPWGPGWAMDLPSLQEIRIQEKRRAGKVSSLIAYELFTPLNTYYARFAEVRPVKELGGSRLQVPDVDGPFHGLAKARPDFLNSAETIVLYLKNGQEWHFTKPGDLVAVKDGPQITVYERGSDGQVPRIVGLMGGAIAAMIEIEYNSQGALAKAVGRNLETSGTNSVEVHYAYEPSGRLSSVSSVEVHNNAYKNKSNSITTTELGAVGYMYRDSRVASVTWSEPFPGAVPQTVATFEYNERGQMTAETRGEQTWQYKVKAYPGGIEAAIAGENNEQAQSRRRYDDQMRPLEATDPDGTRTVWTYQPDDAVETALIATDGRKISVTDSADGRQRTVSADGQTPLVAHFDPGGNLTRIEEGRRVLLTQQWRPDGQPARAETETQGVSYSYTEHGLLAAIVVHPPNAGEKIAHWREARVDQRGNPLEVTDYTGLHLQFDYDASGAISAAVQKTDRGNLGFTVARNDEGRVQAVSSSWGNAAYVYDENGSLRRIESKRDKQSASIEFTGGLVRNIKAFDGGVTRFEYHDKGHLSGAPRSVVCASGIKLSHEYEPEGRLQAVKVGDERRVRLSYDAEGRVASYIWQPIR